MNKKLNSGERFVFKITLFMLHWFDPLIGSLLGALSGWFVGLSRIGGWILLVLNRPDITMVQLGATIGFITAFFRFLKPSNEWTVVKKE